MRDRRNYGSRPLVNVAGREPQNPNTLCSQPGIALSVVRDLIRFLVDGAIDLHAQPRRRTVEIENV